MQLVIDRASHRDHVASLIVVISLAMGELHLLFFTNLLETVAFGPGSRRKTRFICALAFSRAVEPDVSTALLAWTQRASSSRVLSTITCQSRSRALRVWL